MENCDPVPGCALLRPRRPRHGGNQQSGSKFTPPHSITLPAPSRRRTGRNAGKFGSSSYGRLAHKNSSQCGSGDIVGEVERS
jgi:hypothetical protein